MTTSSFSAQSPEQLSSPLFESAQSRHLKSGQMLFAAGDAGNGCYRIEEGVVKVLASSRRGKEMTIAILGPGAIVGELSMIDGLPRSVSIVALSDCRLLFVSREDFAKCVRDNPAIYKGLADILAARLRATDEALVAANFMPAGGRLARAFLDLAKFLGQNSGPGRKTLTHKISLSDLAAMTGVARENVSRTLTDWRKKKIVSKSSGYYCLENIAALRREAEDL